MRSEPWQALGDVRHPASAYATHRTPQPSTACYDRAKLESSKRLVITGSLATIMGTAVSAVLSLAYISLGARSLGPAEYGRVAVAISTAQLVFVVLNPFEAGLTLRIASFTGPGAGASLRTFLLRGVRGIGLLTGAVLGLWAACCMLAGAQAPQYWVALFFAMSMVATLPRAVLRGRESFGALALNWVLESATRLAAGLALVHLGFGAGGMVAGYALGMVIALAHGLRKAQRGLPPAEHDRDAERPVLADLLVPMRTLSVPMISLHVYTAVAVSADMMFADHYLSAEAAGAYGGAAAIARIVLVGGNPVLLVLFSRLASMSAQRANTTAMIRLGGLAVVGGLGASLIIPTLAGSLLVHAFLGRAFAEANALLLWQWATACTLIAHGFFAESMLATARVRGGALFVAPAIVMVGSLLVWHDSGVMIARTTFAVCALAGSLVLAALWRLRIPAHAASADAL